jgi:prepilin-type N-terminal cleavage/methylation domain-containing protein
MTRTQERKGFTLIEILIVVAIIAILASVILVGLGPTQSLGRDARRVSDLHEVQNGLELYYNSQGSYPIADDTVWTNLGTALNAAVPSISAIPNDPSGGTHSYIYGTDAKGASYILQATLENPSGGPWQGYTAPASSTVTAESVKYYGTGKPDCTVPDYCITL